MKDYRLHIKKNLAATYGCVLELRLNGSKNLSRNAHDNKAVLTHLYAFSLGSSQSG